MSVQTPAPRPTRGTAAGPVGVLASLLTVTALLVGLVAVLLVFVVAPLVVLAVGLLALLTARIGRP